MAYIVVYHKDQEVTRRELFTAIVVGRSVECELSIHDILLSRRHCRIEPAGDGWAISDLGSKNGTRVGGNPVFQLMLTDDDVIQIGSTAIRFQAGAFVPASKPKPTGIKRPADPILALAGTVQGFKYVCPTIAPNGIPLPKPRPAPKEPVGYTSDDVRSMVSDLVSSSWDSIYENAKRSDPVMAHAPLASAVRRRRTHEPRVDFGLQVHPEPQEIVLPLPPIQPRTVMARRSPRRKFSTPRVPMLVRNLATIFQWLALLMLVWHR